MLGVCQGPVVAWPDQVVVETGVSVLVSWSGVLGVEGSERADSDWFRRAGSYMVIPMGGAGFMVVVAGDCASLIGSGFDGGSKGVGCSRTGCCR